MDNKLVMISIAAVIGIIVLGSVLMPIMNDATAKEDTFTNEGYYTMDSVTDESSRIITWSKATPTKITIDGGDFDMSFAEVNRSYTLIGSESLIVRYQKDSSVTGIQLYGGSTYTSFHTGSAATAGDTITITLDAGDVTVLTDGTSPLSVTKSVGTDAYIINPTNDGDYSYVMKKADKAAFVLGDSTIKFLGVSVAAGPSGIAIYGTGSIDDGMTLSTIYKQNTITSVTYSDPVVTDEEVSGYVEDVYKLDKYNFTITYDSSTYDATYSYFLVPAEVTAERSVHFTDGQNAIFAAIPVMIILAVLLGVVALVIRSRMD